MTWKSFALINLSVPLILLLAGSPPAHARLQPVFNTEIDVPCKLSIGKVKKGIRGSLRVEGGGYFGRWLVKDKKPGLIEATLFVRRHVLVLDLIYNTKQVKVRYKSSQNLKHKKRGDKDLIHPNANRWIQNMVIDVSQGLSYECA